MSKIPSSKFIKVLSKHPTYKGGLSLYLSIFCINGKAVLSASVMSTADWGGTTYCLTDLDASTPEEVLYHLNLNHVNLDGSASFVTGDEDCALVMKYGENQIDDFIACADRALLKTGGTTLQDVFIEYLTLHEEVGSLRISDAEVSPTSVVMSPLTQLAHLDTSGVTCYDTLSDLKDLVLPVTNYNHTSAISVHDPKTGHRQGFACTNGHALAYVPDEDLLETSRIKVDQYILKSIRGRGYTVLDLLKGSDRERGMTGLLPSGEGFSIVWRHEDGGVSHDQINAVHPANMLGPTCTFDFLLDLAGKPSQLQKVHVGVLTLQRDGYPAIQRWFSAHNLSADKDKLEFAVSSISDAVEVDVDLLEYEEGGGSSRLPESDLVFSLGLIDGKLLKPIANSNLPKENKFRVYAGSYETNRKPWCITTSACSFDPYAASCLVMPRLSADFSNFTGSSKRALGVI